MARHIRILMRRYTYKGLIGLCAGRPFVQIILLENKLTSAHVGYCVGYACQAVTNTQGDNGFGTTDKG